MKLNSMGLRLLYTEQGSYLRLQLVNVTDRLEEEIKNVKILAKYISMI